MDCHILVTEGSYRDVEGAIKEAGKRPRGPHHGRIMELTAPNLLTLMRIALVPVLVWLLMYPAPGPSAIAAGVFFVATLSDFFDGYIARSYGSGTTLGKFLDPLADKLLVTAALIMLATMPRFPRVPAWMVVVLVTREIAVTGLRAMAAAEGQVM